MALEHGATILAMELARVRSLAESELRLRRDLSTSSSPAPTRRVARPCVALGYDLQRRIGWWSSRASRRSAAASATGRLVLPGGAPRRARGTGGSLLVARGSQVVLLADAEADWETLRKAVLRELGGGRARMGVGERYDGSPTSRARYRQASSHCGCRPSRVETPRSLRRPRRLPAVRGDRGPRGGRVFRAAMARPPPGATTSGGARSWSAPCPSTWSGAQLRGHREGAHRPSEHAEVPAASDPTNLRPRPRRPETCFNLHLATRAWSTLDMLRSCR